MPYPARKTNVDEFVIKWYTILYNARFRQKTPCGRDSGKVQTSRVGRSFFSVQGILRRREIQGPPPTNREAYQSILTIALPALVELVFTSLINTCDMLMVSSLGTFAITSIGITNQPRMIVVVLFMAVNIGVTSIVARTKGEGNPRAACLCLRQALLMIVLLDVVLLTTAIVFAPEFLTFAGANEECLPYATDYFRIIVAGLSVQQFGACIVAAQRGAGDNRFLAVVSLIGVAILRPAMSFLLVTWLQYGLIGAWIATLIDMAVRAAVTALRFVSGKWVTKVV